MSIPKKRFRGLRSPGMPTGFLLGRASPKRGDVELLDIKQLQRLGVTTSQQASQISNSPTGVAAGTYGDSTNVGQFTVNAAGRLTFAANVPIAFPPSDGTWIPMVDGAEPPGFITDGAGQLIVVAYTP